MSSPEPSNRVRDFLTVAVDLKMLTAAAADELINESQSRNIDASQLVLQKSLLNAAQVDIIETLLRPKEVVPGYEIVDVLGHGGMGVVYRARQLNLDRIVALKTILVSQMSNQIALARFEQEAMTVGRLRHPNIVAAYDFGRHEGRLFFAMEFVEGEDVEQLIQRWRQQGVHRLQDEETAWGLARQTAAGLSHAAQAGIVHRDIKPANLLLVDPPEGSPLPAGLPMVKIADFGLAYLTSEAEPENRLTAANATVGSPHYMAPEQLTGETLDLRTDIYALGATVYHMLAGQPPFKGKSLSQIITQKLSGTGPSLHDMCPEITAESDELVREMMAVDPKDRIGDYSELIKRMDELSSALISDTATMPIAGKGVGSALAETAQLEKVTVSEQTGRTEPTEELTTAGKPVAWRKPTIVGLAVVGLLIGVAIVGSFLGSDRSPAVGQRDMVPSDWSDYLFDGQDLQVWLSNSTGVWVQDHDSEGGKVLAGSSGFVRRKLIRADQSKPRPLKHFRLTFFLAMHKASKVELHFEIFSNAVGGGSRNVLRATPNAVWLGTCTADRGVFMPLTEPAPLIKDLERMHVITLERQPSDWWVLIDDQLVGTIPFRKGPQLSEFRLGVENGPAWFSDIVVEELAPPRETE